MLALLILLFGLVGPASAAELDDAVATAQRGDYATALRRLSPLAEKGDARAEFDIGFMHAYGWGVPRNPAEAIASYRKAADRGLAARPSLAHYVQTREELLWRAGDVLGWIDSGKLKLKIDKTYALGDAAQAHRDLEARRTSGKLLLIP
jgi:TPR repeat protein